MKTIYFDVITQLNGFMVVCPKIVCFELAEFFYTTVSNDGGGIIVPDKDENLLSKKELKSFIKNDENIFFDEKSKNFRRLNFLI